MTISIRTGCCRDVLRTLPDESVHCVVTSPPYWGLEMARNRITNDAPLFVEMAPAYNANDDFAKSIDACYAAIRERKANGGPDWTPPEVKS